MSYHYGFNDKDAARRRHLEYLERTIRPWEHGRVVLSPQVASIPGMRELALWLEYRLPRHSLVRVGRSPRGNQFRSSSHVKGMKLVRDTFDPMFALRLGVEGVLVLS